jgi:hypothetical protein
VGSTIRRYPQPVGIDGDRDVAVAIGAHDSTRDRRQDAEHPRGRFVLGISLPDGDNSNLRADGVQEPVVVNVAAVPGHDEHIGGEPCPRDAGQVRSVEIAGDERRNTRQHQLHDTPRARLRDDAPSQDTDGVSLTDRGGREGDVRRGRPSPDADLGISGEAAACVDGGDRSTMKRPWHPADRGRRPAGQHDPRQRSNAEHVEAAIDRRRRGSGVNENG